MSRLRVGGHIIGTRAGGNLRHYGTSATYVPPGNVAPTASFTQTTTGLTVNVTSTSTDSDGTIVSYAWAWGDTSTSTGATATHTYAAAGAYTVTLTVTDNQGGTGTATVVVNPAVTVATLPTSGLRSFHRGSGNPAMRPEHTMLAYEYAMALGPNILDVDMQQTSDGVLVAMHDATVDKTTAGTGNVSSFTYANLPQVYMPEVVGSYYTPQPVPKIDDLFTTYGGKVILNMEPKTGGDVQALVDLIKARGLAASCIINSQDPAVVKVATDQGIAGHVWNVTSTALADAAAVANPYLMEINTLSSVTTTLVNYIHGKGAKAFQGPTADRYGMSVGVAAGVDGITMDSPAYLLGTPENKANIAGEVTTQRVGEGWWRKPATSNGNYAFPVFATDGVKLSTGATTQTSADSAWTKRGNYRFGTICGPKPTSYTYRTRIRWDAIPPSGAATSRTGFRFCNVDDRGDGEDNATGAGYTIGMRQNGMMHVWRNVANTAGVLLGEVQTAAITTAGQVIEHLVTVSPTSISITRVDTGNTLTFNDTTYRGNYHWVQGNNFGYEATLLTLEWAAV